MAASEVVASYKKLGLVEEAFRSLKTAQLEVLSIDPLQLIDAMVLSTAIILNSRQVGCTRSENCFHRWHLNLKRDALRCLIPNWARDPKIAYKTINARAESVDTAPSIKDDSPFVFAGLWEGWKHPANGEWLRTCTIITGEPNEFVGEIHTRMRVILPDEHHDLGYLVKLEKKSWARSRRTE